MRTALRREPEAPQLQSHRLKLEQIRVKKLESFHRGAMQVREQARASLRAQEAEAASAMAEGRPVASPVTLDEARQALDQAVQAERIARQALAQGRENLERKQQREPSTQELRELQAKFEQNFKDLHQHMVPMMAAIDGLFAVQVQARTVLGPSHPLQDLPWPTLDGIRRRCRTWLQSRNAHKGRWRS